MYIGKKQKAIYHPKPWQLPTHIYMHTTEIVLPHMNSCEETIIEGEPHWHLNAGCVVIIGEENGISFISSKGNEPVHTQSSAAYS